MCLHGVGKLEKPQRVGDVDAALAYGSGNIVVRMFEVARQRLITPGLFQRVEIRALHVFDDGKLQRLIVSRLDRMNRNLMQSGALRGAPASFAGDDLK